MDYPFKPLLRFWRLLRVQASPGNAQRIMGWSLKLLLFEPFRWIERGWVHLAGVSLIPVKPPVFVLGHWRSGTTHLQTLLAERPDLATLNLFQAVFSEQFLVTESWLKPLLQRLYRWTKQQNHFHQRPLDWNEAQEEDLALVSMLCLHSPYWGRLLGRRAVFREIEGAQRMQPYHAFLQKLQYRYPQQRLVLKSPPNLLYVPDLVERYPEARFLYLVRDPLDVYHSMQKLWRANLAHFAFCPLTERQIHEAIVEDYAELIEAWCQFRELIPNGQLLEISYEQLCQNPSKTRAQIANFLGDRQPVFPPSSDPAFVPTPYTTPPELETELRERWAAYWNR